jgi:hypothetical protein
MEVKQENLSYAEKIEKYDKKPVLYIYVIDLDYTSNVPELKIGYTTDLKNIISEYQKLYENGVVGFILPIYKEFKGLDSFIEVLFENVITTDGNYKLEIQKANFVVSNIANIINVFAPLKI